MINIYSAGKHESTISKAAKAVLKKFDIKERDVEIEVELLDSEEMINLNNDSRGINALTDVLSFPALTGEILPFDKSKYPEDIDPETDAVMLGEFYISYEKAEEQAEEYGHSLSREYAFLTVHGMLHLLGFDHIEESDRIKMESLQEEILNEAGFARDEEDKNVTTKFGSVAIVGRPNAGKSTLINALVGEKVAIVSWKPQTTRNRILGIMNTENAQIAFVDTPGLHAPQNSLGKYMMRSVTAALESVDIIIYVIDAEKGIGERDILNINRYIGEAGKKVVIAVNKIDHVTKEKVAEILNLITEIKDAEAVVPISALKEKNLEPLKEELLKILPFGEKQFSDDAFTDRSMRFMAAELIREKALRLLDKEVPYGIGVAINKYDINERGIIEIDADVICQKAAHKPIVLGKGGETVKKIATYARQDIEAMTGGKVFLTLWVRVKDEWRDNPTVLSELGYDKNNY